MRKPRILLALLPLLLLVGVTGIWFSTIKTPVPLAPGWRVGQRWKINVFHRRYKNREAAPDPWMFRVTNKDAIDGGRAIFTIKASSIKDRAYYFMIRIRHPDLTLLNIVTYRGNRVIMNEAPQSSAFFFNQEGAWSMPLDFSAFPVYVLSREQQARNLVEGKVVELDGGGFPVWQRSKLTQKVLPGRVVRLLEITITASDGRALIQNHQAWEVGKPWPTNAVRNINGRLISAAVLVDD